MTKLEQARRDVAKQSAAIAETNAMRPAAEAKVAEAQAALAALNARAVAQQTKHAECERVLRVAEQEALDQHCVELAAETIKLQTDPLRNRDRVIANLHLLRRAVRSPLDWPINRPYFIEPIVSQALSLLPARDALDTPVNELSHRGTPWADRVRSLLQEFEADAPLQAA